MKKEPLKIIFYLILYIFGGRIKPNSKPMSKIKKNFKSPQNSFTFFSKLILLRVGWVWYQKNLPHHHPPIEGKQLKFRRVCSLYNK